MIEFQTEIQGSLKKLIVFKNSKGHPLNMAKLPIMAYGAENMDPYWRYELHLFCAIKV